MSEKNDHGRPLPRGMNGEHFGAEGDPPAPSDLRRRQPPAAGGGREDSISFTNRAQRAQSVRLVADDGSLDLAMTVEPGETVYAGVDVPRPPSPGGGRDYSQDELRAWHDGYNTAADADNPPAAPLAVQGCERCKELEHQVDVLERCKVTQRRAIDRLIASQRPAPAQGGEGAGND